MRSEPHSRISASKGEESPIRAGLCRSSYVLTDGLIRNRDQNPGLDESWIH